MSRRIKTEDDYLVAGRSLGPVLATFTVFATWFGAETCIGAAGAVYQMGLSGGTADPFGYALCVIITGLVLAVPLWRLRLTTIADLFRIRFDPTVERVAVLLMVPTSLFWAAAQIRAFGQVLSAASGLDVALTVTIAAGVVIAYTMFGGLLADAWTDLVQGIALIVGLAILFGIVVRTEGLDIISALGPGALNPLGSEPRPILEIVEEWAVPVVGSLVAAELLARIIATRSEAVARNATVVAGVAYFGIGLMPVILGLMGAALMPGLAEPEQILPLLAERYLPTGLYILFAGALVSAILSTVDSALLAASALVSHNIVVQMKPGLSDRNKVRVARAGVAIFGVAAYLMAVRAERVYELVEESSAFGTAGIVTIVMFGLFTKIGGRASALAALIAGVTAWVGGAYILDLPYPYITSMVWAITAYLVVAAAGSVPERELVPIT
ncbi:MAG: sodium:solute symporter family protein [Gemmatimonadetes bacterium]|nr:sodium:solute symporter family protein [Gemmatimonadota bacterium]MDA1103363.1 sodium:solute symporter family protein [Gemmatimonadota bacterium]